MDQMRQAMIFWANLDQSEYNILCNWLVNSRESVMSPDIWSRLVSTKSREEWNIVKHPVHNEGPRMTQMKSYCHYIFLLSLLAVCPSDFDRAAGTDSCMKVYYEREQVRTQPEAERECQSLHPSSHLVTVDTIAKHDYLADILSRLPRKWPTCLTFHGRKMTIATWDHTLRV